MSPRWRSAGWGRGRGSQRRRLSGPPIRRAAPNSVTEATLESPTVGRAVRLAGTLFVVSAFVSVATLGERIAFLLILPGREAAAKTGQFFSPTVAAIVCGTLGTSLRGGSRKYRKLALGITLFFAAAFALLKYRALATGRHGPSVYAITEYVFFSSAVLPLLARYPTRVHLWIGYIMGTLWITYALLFLISGGR